ncbi:MAG: polyphosphate:AMP phosphotransferase [Gammaproteobacteria bacterium]|nr:polyphosphate:AMP phosphotransferase [Gammaproteobacteria bacterium]
MFETAELNQNISKQSFSEQEPDLRCRLLKAQHQIQAAGIPVIILLSGVEGSDRSGVVKRLNKWLDPRYLRTHAFWDVTDEEQQRPNYWRYWRCLPGRGHTAIMFGSWYTQPIIDSAFERMDQDQLRLALHQVNIHERLLHNDGYIIIKLWFHISHKTQKQRLEKKHRFKKSPTAALFRKNSSHYDQFLKVSETAIRATDTAEAPWHIIEATDKFYRDITAAEIILETLERHLNTEITPPAVGITNPSHLSKTILDNLDTSLSVETDLYDQQLASYQKKLAKLVWKAKDQQRSCILLFEGWDASGKGGVIRRITSAIDARLYQVIPIAAPSDEELDHHYLWRFWRHIPRNGYLTVYDRSWYGRVLVERVEQFATPDQWQRAYHEINFFEQQLIDDNILVFKFWLHISKDEQLKRFEERQQTPWKQHKITDEDWRNREQWDGYQLAVHEMISRTSTEQCPWHLIIGNDKKYGRLQVLQILCEGLKQALS